MEPNTKTIFSLNELQLNHDVIALWEHPDSNTSLQPFCLEQGRTEDNPLHDRMVGQTICPEMILVSPQQSNHQAILIIGGGGYTKFALDKEGIDIAEALAALGYTCFVLNHRMPNDYHPLGSDVLLADAQRAMRHIRSGQGQLSYSTVGVIGFSAGGQLAGWIASDYDKSTYVLEDEIDQLSARPDYVGLIYPVISMDDELTHPGTKQRLVEGTLPAKLGKDYSVDRKVMPSTSPCFILHAADDPAVSPENSIAMWRALTQQGVPVELRIVERGGHGFGIRKTKGLTVEGWINQFDLWVHRHRQQ